MNQSFATAFFPGTQPIGKRIRAVNADQPGEWRTIVGVVPNIMQGDGIRQRFLPLIYFPLRQAPLRVAFVLARTSVPAEQVAQAARTGIQNIDSDVALEDFTSLKASFGFDRDRMDPEHSELGKHAAVAPVFAIIALLLTAAGLYAVLAHSISQRTKEIGVRMAVGAAAENIRRMVFRDGMLPVGLGLLLGLTASLAVNRILRSQLVGISPYDPPTMIAAPVVLIAIALLACHVPARRAMNVDPAIALRHD